jgi:hypothetical protein
MVDVAREEDNQRVEPSRNDAIDRGRKRHRPGRVLTEPTQKQRFIRKRMRPASEGRRWSRARRIETGADDAITDLPEQATLAKLVA